MLGQQWRFLCAGSTASGKSISGGAIAGIVIGVLAGIALLLCLGFFLTKSGPFYGRRRHERRTDKLPELKSVKAIRPYGEEHADELADLPQLPASLQPGQNPFLPSMLSWKPDEGVVKPSGDTSFPAIRSIRTEVDSPGKIEMEPGLGLGLGPPSGIKIRHETGLTKSAALQVFPQHIKALVFTEDGLEPVLHKAENSKTPCRTA